MERDTAILGNRRSRIAGVAHNRHLPLGSLKSNLVRAAGVQSKLEQGALLRRLENLPVEFSPFSVGVIGRHNHRLPIRLRYKVGPAANAAESPRYHRQILLLHRPLPKLPAEAPSRRRGARQDHEPGGGSVKSMNEPQKWLIVRPVFSHIPLSARENIPIARVVGLGQAPGRLVHYQKLVVFVEDGHWQLDNGLNAEIDESSFFNTRRRRTVRPYGFCAKALMNSSAANTLQRMTQKLALPPLSDRPMPRVFWCVLLSLLLTTLFVAPASAQSEGIGIGASLGVTNAPSVAAPNPVGVNAKFWLSDRQAVSSMSSFFIGDSSPSSPSYWLIQGDYLFHDFNKLDVGEGLMALYLGAGAQVVIIEDRDNQFSLRGPLGINYMMGSAPIDIFAEVAPTLSVTDPTALRFDGAIGFRYFLSR